MPRAPARTPPTPFQSDWDFGPLVGQHGFPCSMALGVHALRPRWAPLRPHRRGQLCPRSSAGASRVGGDREGGHTLSCTDRISASLVVEGACGDGHGCSTAPGHPPSRSLGCHRNKSSKRKKINQLFSPVWCWGLVSAVWRRHREG